MGHCGRQQPGSGDGHLGQFIINGNLPTTIDGVSVTVGGAPAYVYYVSSTQINFIVPPNLPPDPSRWW